MNASTAGGTSRDDLAPRLTENTVYDGGETGEVAEAPEVAPAFDHAPTSGAPPAPGEHGDGTGHRSSQRHTQVHPQPSNTPSHRFTRNRQSMLMSRTDTFHLAAQIELFSLLCCQIGMLFSVGAAAHACEYNRPAVSRVSSESKSVQSLPDELFFSFFLLGFGF